MRIARNLSLGVPGAPGLLALFFSVAACAAAPAPVAAPKASTPTVPPAPATPDLVEPMGKLDFMRGVWAGTAEGTDAQGNPYKVTQTERMGPLLGGDIIVIEGRGYKEDRSTAFNAFAVVSWNRQTSKYEIRSYTQGMAGTFELKLTDDGYTWEVPAGPGAVMRFTAQVQGKYWYEIGEYIAAGKPPVQAFQMKLLRIEANTAWPLETPVPPDVAPKP